MMIHPIVKRSPCDIVARLGPNEEQLPAVTTRSCDVVVTAGAGSGKTRTLVARYLALLAEEVPLRSIVAITFTRKAAREMRNRVRAEIRGYLDQAELSRQDYLFWDGLYNQLNAARIGTIHNLCTEILRSHPVEAIIDPRFDVLEEGQTAILRAQAVDEALAWAADDVDGAALFTLLGEGGLRGLLESLMNRRLEAVVALAGLTYPLWPEWQAALVAPIKDFLDSRPVSAGMAELSGLRDNGTLAWATAEGDALAQPLAELLRLWDEIQAAAAADDWPAVSVRLQPLRQNMKAVGRKGTWAPADREAVARRHPKAVIGELQGLYDEALAGLVGSGLNLALDQAWAEALPAVQRVFNQALATYDSLKQERDALDFDDLEEVALRLLENNPTVLAYWQEEVAALLVDEYQDTNGRQRDLVNLLNGKGDRLFIVGDAKQSIYRFRGADVSVFRAERVRIEAGGAAFALTTSYRAHRRLVQALNDLLRPVLGDVEDPARPWAEPFAPLTHHREAPRPGVEPPYIELQLAVGSKSDGGLDRAARVLANSLIDLVEEPDSLLAYGDVAILCRASTSFAAYENALDQASVPYLTVAGRGFFERPEIRDLLNALQALNDPADDLALVGLLRSPVIGFSDADLYALCQDWSEASRATPLWSFLQGREDNLARQAVATIQPLHDQAGRMLVADLLKAFIDATGYRAALRWAGYPRAARNVNKLLVDAHASRIVSVDAFLEYITGLKTAAVREGEARAMPENAVRIMSIHQAKGLEFPVVVIGDIGYHRIFRGGLIVDAEKGIFPPLQDDIGNRSGLYQQLAAREQDQEEAESDRLLYVAATRAQEKLILIGCVRLTGQSKIGWLQGWLKAVAIPLGLAERQIAYNPEGDQVRRFSLPAANGEIGCAIYEPNAVEIRPVTGETQTPPPAGHWQPVLVEPIPAGLRGVDEGVAEVEREPSRRVWRIVPDKPQRKAPAWIVGRLVHEALAAWRFPGDGFREWVEARAGDYGLVDPVQIGNAGSQVEGLLSRFRAHPLFAEIETAGKRYHEIPYDMVDENGLATHGVIDVLYLKDGRWTVVEFKTDAIRHEGRLAGFLMDQGYLQQTERYAAAVEQLLGRRPRVLLCMLNVAGEVRIVEIPGA